MGEPYIWKEINSISCSTTEAHIDLKYIPDLIILGNADSTNIIYVDFDERAKTTTGIPINPNKVEKIELKARRISAIASGGTPRLYIMALAMKRAKW